MGRCCPSILAKVVLVALIIFGARAACQEGPQSAPVPQRRDERTLLFVGDVMLARGVERKMMAKGDWTYPFLKIAETLRAADLVFGNLECPVSDTGRNLHHLYSLRADPKALEGVKVAGFRVLSVANNHIDDWDRPALVDTLARLRAAGILPVGAGADDLEAHHPVIVNLEGTKLAFLAYVGIEPKDASAGPHRPGVAWLDPDRAAADIRLARNLADLVIVSLHWGVEYSTRPTRDQVKLAHDLVDTGADLVVGAHPHVVQPVEQYHDRWIAYSLGNFIFDQKNPATHRGLMLKATLRDKQIAEVTSIPTSIDGALQATIAPPKEPASRSESLAQKTKVVRAQ